MASPSMSLNLTITPDMSTTAAFGAILRANYDFVRAWAPVAYEGKDIEGVHQVRVGMRRMRSAVIVFRKAIPRELTDAWGEEMRWLANAMGPARDLDVFITEAMDAVTGKIPLPAGEERIRQLAEQHRAEAYAQVRAAIDSDRYKKYTTGLNHWLKEQGWYQADMPGKVRARMNKTVASYATSVLNKRVSQTLQDGARINEMSTEELHMLRIDCKKLRYATEFFGSLFNKKGMGQFTGYLKELQGLLGTMNDVTVMQGLLDALIQDVDERETVKYAGALIGWRARQYEEVRGTLGESWEAFANTIPPWFKGVGE
ncbi:MAG: CHAD domain-containing protein [Magnetococcales bacterium]|nr:CHAD domain-containing protein [Magnetococcales bacterium]